MKKMMVHNKAICMIVWRPDLGCGSRVLPQKHNILFMERTSWNHYKLVDVVNLKTPLVFYFELFMNVCYGLILQDKVCPWFCYLFLLWKSMLRVFRCFAFILRNSNIFLFVVGGRTKLFNTTPLLISLHSPLSCEIKNM